MSRYNLAEKTKAEALSNGADLVGILNVASLPEHEKAILSILPSAANIVVVASKHSLSSLRSSVNHMAQFDTIHTYHESARASHNVSRFLESEGFASVAVPAFIPLDMKEPKKGMRGEVCWRSAGVRAGLGSYGENGLLVTKEFGTAVRIGGVVTAAKLEPDSSLTEDVCDHCMKCIESCPVGALAEGGRIDKKKCGNFLFAYGLRFFQQFMEGMIRKPSSEMYEAIQGFGFREMWQTFMTGNYYYCFQCQSQCPSKLFGL